MIHKFENIIHWAVMLLAAIVLLSACAKKPQYTCICLDPGGQEVYNRVITSEDYSAAYLECKRVQSPSVDCRIK